MLAKTVETNDKDSRFLDHNFMDADSDLSFKLSSLITKVDSIKRQLQRVETSLKENQKTNYVPADYEGWFSTITSLKEVRDARKAWIQEMDDKAFDLRIACHIGKYLEDANKEQVIFKKSIERFLCAIKHVWQRELDLLFGWKAVLFTRET